MPKLTRREDGSVVWDYDLPKAKRPAKTSAKKAASKKPATTESKE